MTRTVASTRPGGSCERRRLMLYSTAILCAVSLSVALVTGLHFRGPSGEAWQRGMLLAVGPTLVLVIAGGTLLARATNPFIRRLEDVNAKLEAQAAQLAQTNRDLDDFTCIASHDLKEPLHGISGYCQILLEEYGPKLDADGRRRLEAMVELCLRLERLIDDVLTYSQIGRQQPDVMDADLNEIVADVLATLGPAIDRRQANVGVTGRLPELSADRVWTGEVFRNLIANALKFNDSPRPRVEIGCQGETIYVRDNGIGIVPCHHEAIFAMFRRLHGRGQYEGTGAGLSFVRKIVEAHGGRVWVESSPGEGSTFYFTLSPAADRVAASSVSP